MLIGYRTSFPFFFSGSRPNNLLASVGSSRAIISMPFVKQREIFVTLRTWAGKNAFRNVVM